MMAGPQTRVPIDEGAHGARSRDEYGAPLPRPSSKASGVGPSILKLALFLLLAFICATVLTALVLWRWGY